MHAYCLFCETQRCLLIARQIEQKYGVQCIYPQIVQRKWVKGQCLEERHYWLPGYLFLYSEDELWPNEFRLNGVIRWLGRDELKGQDLSFAETLLKQNGIMGTIRLVEVGDRCHVADPIWENLSGVVTKIDRGRKRCQGEFTFATIRRSVWVGYDLVKAETELISES